MSEQNKVKKSIKIFGILSIILFSIVLVYAVEYPQAIVETISLGVDIGGTKEIVEALFSSLGVDTGGTKEIVESILLGATGTLNITSVNLNLRFVASDDTTLVSDLSPTFISLTNTSGTTKYQVLSGWVNVTGLTANANVNITAQIFNTTNTNSFVKVNSSDLVSINVTETMNRDLVLDVYQNVTWSFIKADGSAFTPDFLEVTFGNNGTKANVTSSSVFLNGSNTINRIYWQGGNVKNATTTFLVSSDSQVFVFEGNIVNINLQGRGITDTTLSNIKYDVTLANGTVLSSLSADSSGLYSLGYVGNGTNTITSWWMNIIGNASLSYGPSTDETLTILLNVYKDASGLSRYGLNQTSLTSHSVANKEISFTASTTGTKVLIIQILLGSYTGIESYSLNGSSTSGGDSSVANGLITNITIPFTSPFDIMVKLRSGGGGGAGGGGGGGGGVSSDDDDIPEEGPPLRLGEEPQISTVTSTTTSQGVSENVAVPIQTGLVPPILITCFFGAAFYSLYVKTIKNSINKKKNTMKDRVKQTKNKTKKLMEER